MTLFFAFDWIIYSFVVLIANTESSVLPKPYLNVNETNKFQTCLYYIDPMIYVHLYTFFFSKYSALSGILGAILKYKVLMIIQDTGNLLCQMKQMFQC